jgi:hypothetical protein
MSQHFGPQIKKCIQVTYDVSAIAQDLKKHADTMFGLRGDGLTIDTETVVIPG